MQLLLDITRILLTVHGPCSVPDAVCALTGDSMRKQGLWGPGKLQEFEDGLS
jgi:hypothetical protein